MEMIRKGELGRIFDGADSFRYLYGQAEKRFRQDIEG
jgi:hypothetical protein